MWLKMQNGDDDSSHYRSETGRLYDFMLNMVITYTFSFDRYSDVSCFMQGQCYQWLR